MGGALSWLAVGLGAALGAWLRWALQCWLTTIPGQANPDAAASPLILGSLLTHLNMGTLAANLGGGYLIGLAMGLFADYPSLPPEWRLFAITGFLGGLTTFSSFSAESMVLMQRGHYGWALAHSGLHLFGSIALCIAGFATWRAFST